MALRVGIDMDGTLADLSSAYHDVEQALLDTAGPDGVLPEPPADEEEIEEGKQEKAANEKDEQSRLKAARHEARTRDLVWQQIRATVNFWEGLRPLEPGVVALLHEASVKHGWETFFITQRPGTAGRTVQRQTQLWLESEGFERPSVLTLSGGRGRAAAALELDILVDDYPKNCVDVIAESKCRPILIARTASASDESAKRLGISVVRSMTEALALIEAPAAPPRQSFVSRVFGRKGV